MSHFARPLLTFITLVAIFIIAKRTIDDKKQYQFFKKVKKTAERQRYYRSWIIESAVLFGGLAAVTLLVGWEYRSSILNGSDNLGTIAQFKSIFHADNSTVVGFLIAMAVGAILSMLLPLFTAKKTIPVLGDTAALLPGNNKELAYASILSVNAGVFEELFFRLALPILFYASYGSVEFAVIASVACFGLVHYYQGLVGIIVTMLFGAFMMSIYLSTGNILYPILLHILLDLRSLVLVPIINKHISRRMRTRSL